MSTTVVSDALVTTAQRPRRRLLAFFIRGYSLTVSICISLILALSTYRYGFLWMLGVVASYWVYVIAKRFVRWSKSLQPNYYGSLWFHLIRSLVLTAAVTMWRILLARHTSYLGTSSVDTLWLLYLLATLIMSQRGSTELLLVVTVLAASALVLTDVLLAVSSQTYGWNVWLDATLKAMWLALLAFVFHILLRYMADLKSSLEALTVVQAQIQLKEKEAIALPSNVGEEQVLQAAVEAISTQFGYPHVNIFYVQRNKTLAAVAGACEGGRGLIQEGFRLPLDSGIIGHVIQTGEYYVSNDVHGDHHYYSHPGFPRTRAELVVPIRIGETVEGALDIQAHEKRHFFRHDVEVLGVIADQVARVVDNIRTHSWRHSINQLLESIAGRFISQSELVDSLQEIANAAHEELGADLVVLYEHNPVTRQVTGPVYAGDPKHAEILGRTQLTADSIVYCLIASGRDYYFHDDISLVEDQMFSSPSSFHVRTGLPTFIEREEIRSRCIARLQSGGQCVGLMFLNYCTARQFSEQDKRMVETFAHIAALSIQKAQLQVQRLQLERQSLAQDLHDQLMGSIYGISQILRSVLEDEDLIEQHRVRLSTATNATQSLRKDLKYLHTMLEGIGPQDFPAEVDRLIRGDRELYGVDIDVEWNGDGKRVPPALARELQMVVSEAIYNGIRHGRASKVGLAFEIGVTGVKMTVTDNGRGFCMEELQQPSGISNMRERMLRLGGSLSVDSQPGEGACVVATAPLRVHQQPDLPQT